MTVAESIAESLIARFRDEFLHTEEDNSVSEAYQVLVNRWEWDFNTLRPRSSLQWRTLLAPAQAAEV